jgi:NAD(P)H-hydrate epimerase
MLSGRSKQNILDDRVELSREYAIKHKVYLVLKNAETIISTPDGSQYISELGVPALAKGGSGDILTGLVAAFLAQGYNAIDAIKLALRLQGDGANCAAKIRSDYSVTPEDILQYIGY